jgi:hypothetical protein
VTQQAPDNSAIEALVRRANRWRAVARVALGVIIFASGSVAGWAIHVLRGPPAHGEESFPPDPPVPVLVDQLRHELGLTDDQVRQVTDVYTKNESALHEIRQQIEPQLKEQYDQLSTQMKRVLTAAQFDRWNQRFEAVRNHMLPPPPRDGEEPMRGPPGGLLGPGPDDFGPPRRPPPDAPPPRGPPPPQGPPDM